jgi:threonine dehydrogenase-like Zn-dependent dehydrogenase
MTRPAPNIHALLIANKPSVSTRWEQRLTVLEPSGFLDKVPFGAFTNKGLTVKTGQTHVHRYLQPLLGKIKAGEIDPSFIITHTVNIEDALKMYKTSRDKEDGCIKVVLKPHVQ